jgi:hypothetical protein
MPRRLRQLVLALIAALALAPGAAAAPRVFAMEDYERYFSPGRFQSQSVYHASQGLLVIEARSARRIAGRTVLEQRFRSLDVAANYDLRSDYPFYKIESEGSDQMVWADWLDAYVFEYSDADFDANDSRVWESHDQSLAVSEGDRDAGLLHDFYREADRKGQQDVEALDAQYRRDVVGRWTMRCYYIRDRDYDVECVNTHLPTQREERYYYRKLDLVS